MPKKREEWRDISWAPGYQVSNHVRVQSLPRVTIKSDGVVLPVAGKMLKLLNHQGYRVVSLSINGVVTRKSVHELVVTAFQGPRPSEKHEVAHWDGDRANNYYRNLRWATRKQNVQDARRHGTWSPPPFRPGASNGWAKLTEGEVVQMREWRAAGVGTNELCERFKISRVTAKRIFNGKSWAHVPLCKGLTPAYGRTRRGNTISISDLSESHNVKQGDT